MTLKFLKLAIKIMLALVVLYPAVWIVASLGLLGEVPFGYYGQFNIAKHAIEESGCLESMWYGRNEDIVLEEIYFHVRTKSGVQVRLVFDASNMDVRQACYRPEGISVISPGAEPEQGYSLKALTDLLISKGIQVKDLKDVLCNIDELVFLFESNYDNEAIPRLTFEESCRYLRVAIEKDKAGQ